MKIALTALAGSTIEWYDFFIYGTAAALVFPALFFPEQTPLIGTLLAFSTYAVGFIARPVGGVVFGHFGDKVGRKKALVAALILMGVGTTAMGLLPGFGTIGVLAPILLVFLRFLQGLAVGGQWGGAVLIATENAPANKRGFYGSFAQLGVPAGVLLSNVLFLIIGASMSDAAFVSYGWRIPFFLSVLLIGVGMYIQLRLEETAAFEQVKESHTESRAPIIDVLRTHPGDVVKAAGAFVCNNGTFYLLLVFVVTYVTEELKLPKDIVLTGIIISAVVSAGFSIGAAALSDRIGRQKVFLTGAALAAIWAFPCWWLIDTKQTALIWIAIILGQSFLSIMYGPMAAYFTEMFGTRVRYSGVSLGYQTGSIFGGAFAPIIATSLLAATRSSTAIAAYMLVLALVSLVSCLLIGETYQNDIEATPEEERRLIEESRGSASTA